MFRGRFLHTIDSKGRISIPSKFRDIIIEFYGGKLILTNDLVAKCIAAYTPKGWEDLEEKVRNVSSMDEDVNAFIRLVFASAEDCTIDTQGRILIPPRLREYASLTKEVLITGSPKNKFELWNPGMWEETVSAVDPKVVARKIAELGI